MESRSLLDLSIQAVTFKKFVIFFHSPQHQNMVAANKTTKYGNKRYTKAGVMKYFNLLLARGELDGWCEPPYNIKKTKGGQNKCTLQRNRARAIVRNTLNGLNRLGLLKTK